MAVVPYSLKDAPALIERVFPSQRMSIESYKEQMAVHGKTLTALGSYWKGRKPLILSKACVLGCLLPVTKDLKKDLEVFEKLMGMDPESFVVRLGSHKPSEIVQRVSLDNIYEYFEVDPPESLPRRSPFILEDHRLMDGRLPRIKWRDSIPLSVQREIESRLLPECSYKEIVEMSDRPETCPTVHDHIWDEVNDHLGTEAHSFPELVEQLGIMRFGHRPRVADTFCGSGQIPFEAARLGCHVYASDLNPVACMLTWGAFNIVGAGEDEHRRIRKEQEDLFRKVQAEIDRLGVETDGQGWRGKVYLYCLEVECPSTGWMVPLLPTRIVSKGYRVIAELVPDPARKRYDIRIRSDVSRQELLEAEKGTVRSDGRGQDPYMVHTVDGTEYKTKISTLRGDYAKPDGSTGNRLRLWEEQDFKPRPGDIFQERLYGIEWMRPKKGRKGEEYEFRSVTDDDLRREKVVEDYVADHLKEWQEQGLVPDMRIEPGVETTRLLRERGWTYWHHLFNARHLLIGAFVNQYSSAHLKFGFTQVLNYNSRLCEWHNGGGGGGLVTGAFYNQALNTFYNYACRGFGYVRGLLTRDYSSCSIDASVRTTTACHPAEQVGLEHDVYITDPPYGDAVNYDEILEFFIAWLRKNPPKEFASWTWDSRRSLAIKGTGDDFRRGMVAAYKRMTEMMPDNGIQVIMFTHQSSAIWADMANIVWASGLQVTQAWYVATEVDSALKEGAYVKGTVLLVLRKRNENLQITRDDLGYEIEEEVKNQVDTLVGLNQDTKGLHRDENIFEDADLQIAGYAAALRVLTKYSVINGKDMAVEAMRPRVKGQRNFVDELIDYAVDVATEHLVPEGISRATWEHLRPAERFYLKLLQMEARGLHKLDNYQNFAKAFKVKDFRVLMASGKANAARLKSSMELAKAEMSSDSELGETVVRGVLYGLYEIQKDVDVDEVLTHIANIVPRYYDRRHAVAEIADFMARNLETMRPDEARAARILRESVRNQPV